MRPCLFPIWFFITAIMINSVTGIPVGREDTEEIQHAVCKIMNGELQAVANATITRQLKGVCTYNQLESGIQNLQAKLLEELSEIKILLSKFKTIENTHVKIDSEKTKLRLHNSDTFNYGFKFIDSHFQNNVTHKTKDVFQTQKLLGRDKTCTGQDLSSEYPCNNTIKITENGNEFVYYWQIFKIMTVLEKSGVYISSSDFYVLGHQMHLQLYPHHMGTDMIGIQLRPVTNFHKKYRITIMNRESSKYDINSDIIQDQVGQPVMYRIKPAKLIKNGVSDGALLIKCTIYVSS